MPGVPRDPQKEVPPLTLGWKRLCPQVQRLEAGQGHQLSSIDHQHHLCQHHHRHHHLHQIL